MEKNSTFVRDSQRIKMIDCHVMHIMFADLEAHNNILKVDDDDFIFIRRTNNHKKDQRTQKRSKDTLESDNLFFENQNPLK